MSMSINANRLICRRGQSCIRMWLSVIRAVVLVVALSGHGADAVDEARVPLQDLDWTATQLFMFFEFVPKYTLAECAVQIAYRFEEGSWVDDRTVMRELFNRYLRLNEPKLAIYPVETFADGVGYKQFHFFRDDCERRFEIMRAMLAALRRAYPEILVEIIDAPIPERVLNSVYDESWVDRDEYDPLFWTAKREASESCDAGKWLHVGRLKEADTDYAFNRSLAYLYYSLAARLARDPAVKRVAAEERLRVEPRVSEEDRQKWDRLLRSYLDRRCRPR